MTKKRTLKRLLAACALCGPLLALPPAARAQPAAPPTNGDQGTQAVHLRGGVHGDYTRLVYVLPDGIGFTSQRVGDLVLLSFPGAGKVPGLSPPPGKLLSVSGGDNAAAIGVPAALKTHIWQIGQRVIVDVFPPQSDALDAPDQPSTLPGPPQGKQ